MDRRHPARLRYLVGLVSQTVGRTSGFPFAEGVFGSENFIAETEGSRVAKRTRGHEVRAGLRQGSQEPPVVEESPAGQPARDAADRVPPEVVAFVSARD